MKIVKLLNDFYVNACEFKDAKVKEYRVWRPKGKKYKIIFVVGERTYWREGYASREDAVKKLDQEIGEIKRALEEK